MALRLWELVSILIFFLTTSLAFDPREPQDYYRICPLPECNRCPSADEFRAPGVGFALETSHGTAAVRLHDGTFHHVALIGGDSSYTALMLRFATGPVDRPPAKLDTFWDKLRYTQSRLQRLANKFVGRPATPETAVLAAMVSKLLRATQDWLGDKHAITSAVLSSPDQIHLTDEEIGDIFYYLKLQNLMKNDPLSISNLYATSAAYAGYGKGLCRDYTDAYQCEREESQMSTQRVLHLDSNPDSLGGTMKTLEKALSPSVSASFVATDLGFGLSGDNHDRETFWTRVSERIRGLAKSVERYTYLPHVTDLLLTGPSATDPRYHVAIRKALHGLAANEDALALIEDKSEILDDADDFYELFTFATARGAAEFAKRRQEGPTNCAQTDKCRRRRERAHEEGQLIVSDEKPEL